MINIGKYKICVYAISKNEEKFVERWCESIKEADKVYVLDTGSSDKTVELLLKHGVIVKEAKIDPWRFDVARNMAIDLIDDDMDICISLDLDEVLIPGWRELLENTWKEDTTRAKYTYNWKIENDKPIVSFLADKIHRRQGYRWIHPVHEVLQYENGLENYILIDNLIVNHYPDTEKSRGSYLPLLELSVKEEPLNDRNMHYLGREYMYYKRYNDCIETLTKHLKLKNATWKDERAASMRFIGRSYFNLGRVDEAKIWYDKAIQEAPYLRDGYVEKAILEFNNQAYLETINLLIQAKMIKDHLKTYTNEIFSWDYTIDNLLSVCYFNLGLLDESLYYINKALEYAPDNLMLQNNKDLIIEKISN